MSLFSSKKDSFGLDISSSAVKVVQLHKGFSGKPRLVTYGAISAPDLLAKSDSKSQRKEAADTIRQIVKKAKITTRDVVAALPGSAVFTATITLPQMPKGEMEEAVRWEAKQYVPTPLEEVVLDWQIISQAKGSQEIFLVAAPKTLVSKYVDILALAELNPVALEIQPIALTRSLVPTSQDASLIVDIGSSGTEISIVEAGRLKLARNLQTGSLAFSRAISKGLGVSLEQAEQFKKDFGLSTDKLEGQIPKALSPLINSIIQEIKRSVDFYSTQTSGDIKRIILTGGGSLLPDLSALLANTLSREVYVGNPWSGVDYNSALAPRLEEIAPSFAVAVGLALRNT